MIEQFNTWLLDKQAEIEHIGSILATRLSTEPVELIEQSTEIEVWGSRVGELLANVDAYLSHAKLFYLPDRADMREIERKATVDDKCADIRKVRDILENYKDCIEKRISLVQSILRYEKPHVTPTVMEPYHGRSAADIMRGKHGKREFY